MKDAHLFQKQKTGILAALLLLLLMLTSCSAKKDDELAVYKANMEQFFTNVSTINDAINLIDGSAEDASQKLLTYLDALNTSFSQMAELEVPDGFLGASEYADDAASCMAQAVAYYHDAYDNEYNASYEDAAYQYYERANSDLKQLVKILHGELDLSDQITEDGDASESSFSYEDADTEYDGGDEFDYDETDEDEFSY